METNMEEHAVVGEKRKLMEKIRKRLAKGERGRGDAVTRYKRSHFG
jgi:hypothetical protein